MNHILSSFLAIFCSFSFHNPDLLLRQPVQFVHPLINHRIRRLNLPGQLHLLVLQTRVLQPLIDVERLRDEHYTVKIILIDGN